MVRFPKDVREKAKEVFKTVANTYGSHEKMYEAIAIAILEERERCAAIAENGPRSPIMIALLIRGKPYGWLDKRNN